MKKIIPLLTLCLALAACNSEKPVTFDKTLTHPNGLVIGRPQGFVEIITPDGFQLMETPAPDKPFSADSWLISIQTRNATLPQNEKFEIRRLGNADVFYQINPKKDAHSGEIHHQLLAIKPINNQHIILMLATRDNKTQKIDFDLPWGVLKQAQMETGG